MKVVRVALKELLEQKDVTAYKLCKKTGISQNAMSNLIRNKTSSITFDTLAKICSELECDIADILVLEDVEVE